MVANMAVGFNNIDVEAATRLGIGVSNTPGVLSDTTADLAFALLMTTARRIPEAERFLPARKKRSASGIRRAVVINRAKARSAVVSERTPGVLLTPIPRRVAASTSILLKPTAMFATIFRRGVAAAQVSKKCASMLSVSRQ